MSAVSDNDGKDDQIAQMLAEGATYRRIHAELGICAPRAQRVRLERGIPLPPGRAKRPKPEIAALEQQAIHMLRQGATRREIIAATRLSPNRITQLRKTHNIPVLPRAQQAARSRTLQEALDRNTTPTDDGHLLWTGPTHGRHLQLNANGTTHNAKRVAFRRHHGRDPIAYVIRTCDHPDCIAGAHHADQTIRRNNLRTKP